MEHKKKNDIILIVLLIVAAALCFFAKSGALKNSGTSDKSEDGGLRLVITVDDKEVYSEPAESLELPKELKIEGAEGGSKIFVIDKDAEGKIGVCCTEADCPDKICVQTGRISVPDQPIVCLPHRVTARFVKNS